MIPFETMPLHWVNRLAALSRKELASRFAAAGHAISAEEWAILLHLWREDEQPPGRLSAATVRDPTTMTRLVDGMVGKGLVIRRNDPGDRRRWLICLTDKGRAAEEALGQVAGTLIAAATADIPRREVETTLAVLQRMTANLQTLAGKETK